MYDKKLKPINDHCIEEPGFLVQKHDFKQRGLACDGKFVNFCRTFTKNKTYTRKNVRLWQRPFV